MVLSFSMLSSMPAFAAESDEPLTVENSEWTPKEEEYISPLTGGNLSLDELKSAVLKDEDIPEIIGKDVTDSKQHVNRLWEKESDYNTIVFQNRDGQLIMFMDIIINKTITHKEKQPDL